MIYWYTVILSIGSDSTWAIITVFWKVIKIWGWLRMLAYWCIEYNTVNLFKHSNRWNRFIWILWEYTSSVLFIQIMNLTLPHKNISAILAICISMMYNILQARCTRRVNWCYGSHMNFSIVYGNMVHITFIGQNLAFSNAIYNYWE